MSEIREIAIELRTKADKLLAALGETLPDAAVRPLAVEFCKMNDDQQAQRALAETQVATARQRVNEACFQATNAEREAERQTSLRERGFVSTSKEESARTEAQARRASCDAAKADVIQFQAKVNEGLKLLMADPYWKELKAKYGL